jgi:vacuolar-type H+-ATPase subunit F/Vma7
MFGRYKFEVIYTGNALKTMVLGSRDTVLSFGVVGVDGIVVTTPDEMARELDKSISSGNYSVIMVEEGIALSIEEKINEYRRKKGMIIVEVPSRFTMYKEKDFQEFLKKVLGVRI